MKNFLPENDRGQSLLNVQNKDGSTRGTMASPPWEFLFLKIFITKGYIFFKYF